MTLMTLDAVDALEAALNAVGEPLPGVSRNDVTLEGFAASSAPGVAHRLMLVDEDIENPAAYLGGSAYELGVPAEITYAVEGEPGDAREGVFRAGMEALAATLFPAGQPLAIDGKFDGINLGGKVERLRFAADAGKPPVIATRFTVFLILTAPTPLG